MSGTATLLRDLIDIPERVQTNDFVLSLSDGVTAEGAERTVSTYVVTPQLAAAFDQALGFIQSAVSLRRSAASYLHGSFGSGKSHFMAMLNLLLAGHRRVRAIPELAAAVTKHDAWLTGKRFLMVPFHMIGARDVESAILGGYAEHVRRVHPKAPIPGFYLGERLFEDAGRLRQSLGDAAFFATLNQGRQSDDDWGDLSGAWDGDAYDAAVLEPPEADARQSLIGALIAAFFSSYADVAVARGEAFVDIDTGLAIMSHHAQRLGYDAVVLFLDELILWLATRAGDVDFVSAEGAKLSKLVEAQRAGRPIPIVSFVARQRDLRELIGEHQAGALEVRFIDTLKYWEARFDRINLEDRNLPTIAEKRLLKPKNEAAKQEIDAEFENFANRRRGAVMDTLLGEEGERDLFRKTYPFSPALIQALIAASSVLQRERTALKLMLTLLVKRRDDLRLGSLIPVGDLWDEISAGDQPFSDGMRIQFENAKKLWTQKLVPMLEQVHNTTWQDLRDGNTDPRVSRNFENDARLLKTLLLAALVPEVPALRALTAPRLAALNHGSVMSPVPGREGNDVLGKLRSWASRVGEIRITADTVPTLSLQITGVDVEPILANAAQADNDGTRRGRLQKILFEALGLSLDRSLLGSQPFVEYQHSWWGTKRTVDLYFEIVRDLSHERMRGRPDVPVLVLGMPFDPRGRAPSDHRAHAQAVGDEGAGGLVVWQPSYLSDRALRDLGTLVRIDFLLAGTGDRLAEAARHLSAGDREQARAILRSQQSALHQRIRGCLEAAYGIRPDQDDCLGLVVPVEDRLFSPGPFQPQMPVAPTLKDAISALLDSVFTYLFPAHPKFDRDVQTAALGRVLKEVERAALESDQRIRVDDVAVRRDLAAFAVPLQLGTASQTHFMLDSHWADHFARMHAQAGGGGVLTVGQLSAWIDQPKQMGLPVAVRNLIVLAFAAQADRTLIRNGAPAPGTLERIDDLVELRAQLLPDDETWTTARARAGALFGLVPGEVLKGSTVSSLAADLKTKATERRVELTAFAQTLNQRIAEYGVPTAADRLVTLRAAQTLVADLVGAGDPLATIRALATANLATSEAAVQRCLGSAAALREALSNTQWDIVSVATGLTDERRNAADGLRTRLVEALEADQYLTDLQPVLRDVQTRASRLLAQSVVTSPGPTTPPLEPAPKPVGPPPGEELVEEQQSVEMNAADAEAALERLRDRVHEMPGAKLTLNWRLTRPAARGPA